MNVTAVNIADPDLLVGLSFLRQEASRGLPLISANLTDPSHGAPIFPPHVINTVDNIRVAFFGLLSPDMSADVRKTVGKQVLIKDPIETARTLVKRLQSQADIIILLSDLGFEKEKELLRKVSGIHFILGGREGQYMRSPVWQGNTPILQSYSRGMYAGKLQLTVMNASFPYREDGRTDGNRFQWTLIPLDGSIPEDNLISQWIREAGLEKLHNLR